MDKLFFFLIPLVFGLLFFSIPDSFGQIEKGINYDKEVLQTFPDGSQKIKWTSTPERIYHDNQYKDFLFTDIGDSLQIETMQGSVKLNKSSCGFSFYNKGFISGSPLFIDNITPKMANDGSENWTEISPIINASCETYFDQGNVALVAKKYAAGVGFIEYKYIFENGKFKTQLEATNLSSFTNKKFGFTQTIDLNRDVIKWAGTNKNLDNYNNQTFNRTWIENNESKVMDFLNNFRFDLDIAINNLDSVYVLDTGINKSKLSFNYFHNAFVIMPNDTLIIDPTFNYAGASSEKRPWTAIGTGASCNTASFQGFYTGAEFTFLPTTGDSSGCVSLALEWDISGISFPITSVDNVNLRYDVTATPYSTRNCSFYDLEVTRPSTTGSPGDLWNDIHNGTNFVSNNSGCTTVANDKVLDLGTSADSSYLTHINTGRGWVGLGIRLHDETRGGSYYGQSESGGQWELEITYTSNPPPDSITDLSLSSVTQTTANIAFTPPNLNGGTLQNYMLNVTTPQQSAPITTFKMNGTSSPFVVTGLTIGTSYSAQASAFTEYRGNWTLANVLNFTTATFSPPGAPTLGATALSDTSIRLTSVTGTAGDNSTIWYSVQCELNGAGGWLNTVSNSSLVTRIHEITGLTLGDEIICQWRDGSVDGWSPWSNNATDTLALAIVQSQRTSDPNDRLLTFIEFVESYGGVYFGLGAIPFAIMLIGFMAGKKTVRIFTLITLALMGIVHASGYYHYPEWYWTLSLLFAIGLVMGRHKSD